MLLLLSIILAISDAPPISIAPTKTGTNSMTRACANANLYPHQIMAIVMTSTATLVSVVATHCKILFTLLIPPVAANAGDAASRPMKRMTKSRCAVEDKICCWVVDMRYSKKVVDDGCHGCQDMQ